MKNEISLFIDETNTANTSQDESTTLSIYSDRDLASYPATIQIETMRRVKILKWIKTRLTGGWTEKNLKDLIVEAKKDLQTDIPSVRTLGTWWRLYFNSGYQLLSLIPRHSSKGNTNKRLRDSDEVFFERALERYLVKERPTIAHVYQYYCDTIRLENKSLVIGAVKEISKRAFYKRIDEMPKYDVMVARYGKYRADIEFNAIDGHLPPQRVLERVEIDHTPLDLILIDDELLVPLGRPYLTLLIDSFSKCVVGFYFGFKEPGYESTRKALMHALMPKDYIKQKYPEIVNDWPCRGKMEQLVVDNGAEFWCDSLEQACLEIGINVQYNPIKKPWLKPFVERFFGTLNKKFLVDISGKTFS
ncbi:MAG: transposase family protein, partial [Gammaproteobacteria bacterium]|nr:transposase family protein [Gammaproteobacteria bacterium]